MVLFLPLSLHLLTVTIPNRQLEWLSTAPAPLETRSTQSQAGVGHVSVPHPAGTPVPRSHWLEVPSPRALAAPTRHASPWGLGTAQGRGLRRGAGPGLAAPRTSGRPMAREESTAPIDAGPARANPGRPGGRTRGLAGRAGEAGGGGRWASSWCVTREFLKGEASGAAERALGAVVGGSHRALR